MWFTVLNMYVGMNIRSSSHVVQQLNALGRRHRQAVAGGGQLAGLTTQPRGAGADRKFDARSSAHM